MNHTTLCGWDLTWLDRGLVTARVRVNRTNPPKRLSSKGIYKFGNWDTKESSNGYKWLITSKLSIHNNPYIYIYIWSKYNHIIYLYIYKYIKASFFRSTTVDPELRCCFVAVKCWWYQWTARLETSGLTEVFPNLPRTARDGKKGWSPGSTWQLWNGWRGKSSIISYQWI